MTDISSLLVAQTAADAASQGIKADEYAILLDRLGQPVAGLRHELRSTEQDLARVQTRNAALEKEFKARNETLLSPIQVRINESLKAFAIAQGAVIVLDGARFNGAVLAMKAGTDPASLDLTTAFIDSYNKAHP